IVVSILAVRRPEPRRNGLAFALAWMLGLALLVLLSSLLLPERDGARRDPRPALYSWTWLAIGVLLLLAAAHALRGRPKRDAPTPAGRWTAILNKGSANHVFGVGLFL